MPGVCGRWRNAGRQRGAAACANLRQPAEKTLEEPVGVVYNKETEESEVGQIARAISAGCV